jgi:hypothetical protein
MDGGIEQNPAYGTARTFIYAEYEHQVGCLTLVLTLTGSEYWLSGSLAASLSLQEVVRDIQRRLKRLV